MGWLASEILSILVEAGKTIFSGPWGKFKLYRIKKKLEKDLFYGILEKYGDEVYYNDLDNFLSANKVIYNVIVNCTSVTVFQYKSQSQMIRYYIQLFIEQHPNYARYQIQIQTIIQKCFETIFNALNDTKGEDVRKISNIAKELAGELSVELEEINANLQNINRKVDALLSQSEERGGKAPKFHCEQYFAYLSRLCPDYTISEYIHRNLYYKDALDKNIESLDALLKDREILLLGEAGYGKTYESVALLHKICIDSKADDLIPFYLPLYEYGTIYTSIMDGIYNKIAPFCDENPDELVKQWLSNGQIVLILDGIDDVVSLEARMKFIVDVKNVALQYNQNYFFITSRFNRYHGELGNIKEYFLTGLDENTVRQQLHSSGIYTEIPASYFQLFSNPLFLDAGKKVLKQSNHCDFFNRSVLFEELTILLCGDWDRKKGLPSAQPLCYKDILTILGHFAFNTFCQPSVSLLEFDENMSALLPSENRSLSTSFLTGLGLLRVTDRVSFAHKLFKEYCVAYYLNLQFPFAENRSMYLRLINQEEWKEVFIFASGIYRNLDNQDEFLDFIMGNNLSLYIECINAKSDLGVQSTSADSVSLANRYLNQILRTYTFVISHYLKPITGYFEPRLGETDHDMDKKKICIVGSLSSDGGWLNYWFDRVEESKSDILCIPEGQIATYHKQRESQAVAQRRNIKSFGINLKLSGLEGDSGRKIAIDLVKKELKEVLEHKMLIESKYLLCERVDNCRKKIKKLKDISDLVEMQAFIDDMIHSAMEKDTNIVSYEYNGIELFHMQLLLKYLNSCQINFLDCILPAADTHPVGQKGCWTWDRYSKEQKISRVSKYFYFHELSYLDMVEKNFPVLYNKFSRYLDMPYQNVVIINFKEDKVGQGRYSEPALDYYYIASPYDYPVPPEIRYSKEVKDHTQIYNEIRQSYLRKGKNAHSLTYSRTGFTFTTTSRRTGDENPLSDFVYSSIKDSLEEIFGSL